MRICISNWNIMFLTMETCSIHLAFIVRVRRHHPNSRLWSGIINGVPVEDLHKLLGSVDFGNTSHKCFSYFLKFKELEAVSKLDSRIALWAYGTWGLLCMWWLVLLVKGFHATMPRVASRSFKYHYGSDWQSSMPSRSQILSVEDFSKLVGLVDFLKFKEQDGIGSVTSVDVVPRSCDYLVVICYFWWNYFKIVQEQRSWSQNYYMARTE